MILPRPATVAVVAEESSPPGDIPDDQVFIPYSSPLGFALKVPEGWARRENGDEVSFADKYNRIEVAVGRAEMAPTAQTVKQALERAGRTVKVTNIKAAHLPAGNAVEVTFTSESEPNPVTGKSARLEDVRYVFFREGRLVTLTMSAPKGADNVDAWKMVSESFRWM
jgi:hypothetical protein